MTPLIICRIAAQGDIAAMSEIRLSVTENILSDPSRVTLADYTAYVVGPGQSWVAELDGRIVAFGSANRSGLIWALFVRPGFERRGLGRLVMCQCVAWLEQAGVGRAFLATGAGTRAEGFYRAEGWREVERQDEEIHFERLLGQKPSALNDGHPA